MPKGGQWLGGARSDFIFNRRVEKYKSASTTTYLYNASYGFADWFSIHGLIGFGDVHARLKGDKTLRYPYNFAGGYGWRAKLYKNDKEKIDWVFGFQHISVHPGDQWHNSTKYQIIWDEWQLSTTVSKKVFNLTPYLGAKWSFIYLISKEDGDRKRRISNGSPVGFIAGTDMKINRYTYLNVEGRFLDEMGLNAGFTIRY